MSAIISDCGKYRYRLEHEWSPDRGTVAFIMVNPSTADAEQDDATIRKVRGFAQRHGFSRLIVGNLFAYRATDIRALKGISFGEAVGPDNNFHLHQIIGDADQIVVAWGPVAKVPRAFRNRWQQIVSLSNAWGKPLHCLGTAKDGHPRHPLMTPYSTPLTEWRLTNGQ